MKIKVERSRPHARDELVGFTKVDEIEWDNESYAFNITGLWTRNSDGTLWMAHDSGCSCPSPWEDLDELERVFSVDQLKELRKEHMDRRYGCGVDSSDWESFLATATAALGKLQ